ncbi:hypothetical protein [Pilimelia columellifera]
MTAEIIRVELPVAFTPTWNRINGVSVDGASLTIGPEDFFFDYRSPSWMICDWQRVHDELLPAKEGTDTALEQMALDYVRERGRSTTDAAEVLRAAHEVYAYLFRPEHLTDPELDYVTPRTLVQLRELATLMALNKVELNGDITNVSPVWMLGHAAQVVYDLTEAESQALDECYHSTWFNESRRRESVLAHAALGGRLVHGCQGSPNMSGGCVVPFGADIDAFRRNLAAMRTPWIEQTLDNR